MGKNRKGMERGYIRGGGVEKGARKNGNKGTERANQCEHWWISVLLHTGSGGCGVIAEAGREQEQR